MSERVNGNEHRTAADVVAEVAEQAGVPPAPAYLRRLTVDLRIEAQAADDSSMIALFEDALEEFIERGREGYLTPEESVGDKFESEAGQDVTWRATTEFFENGVRVGVAGPDGARQVPLTMAQLEQWGGGECLVIDGVRYSLEVSRRWRIQTRRNATALSVRATP